MNIESSVSSLVSTAGPLPSQSEARLHMQDFFRILTTQLTTQDPLKPIEDKDFISQMATFSSLQQMELLTKNFNDFRIEQQFLSSQQLIGKTIRAENPDGQIIEGTISRVERHDGKMVPFVGNIRTDYNWITSILEPEKESTINEE